jgi:hypothetical protein
MSPNALSADTQWLALGSNLLMIGVAELAFADLLGNPA